MTDIAKCNKQNITYILRIIELKFYKNVNKKYLIKKVQK